MAKDEDCYKCEKCGHDRFRKDKFAQLKSVRRVMQGNAICDKCFEPAPLTV